MTATPDSLERFVQAQQRDCAQALAEMARAEPLFRRALDVFYAGQPDAATLRLLDPSPP